MAGFDSYDHYLSEKTVAGKSHTRVLNKVTGAMQAAGQWHSLNRIAGQPGALTDPAGTPGAACTDLAGTFAFPNTSPETKHMVAVMAAATQSGLLMVYDRLVHVGAIALNSNGNKTVNSAALPRYTDGVGVQAWLEVVVATTVTAPVVAMNSYTDDAGNSGQAGGNLTFPAAATIVNTLVGPLPLFTGDLGVRAISTINVVTAATAGTANLVLLRPLAYIPINANSGPIPIDFVRGSPSLPQLFDGASLACAWLASSTTTATISALIDVAYS